MFVVVAKNLAFTSVAQNQIEPCVNRRKVGNVLAQAEADSRESIVFALCSIDVRAHPENRLSFLPCYICTHTTHLAQHRKPPTSQSQDVHEKQK